MSIVHDKGISRLKGLAKIEKHKWYFGFICRECGAKIFSLENPHKQTSGNPIIGSGKFSVPCFTCKKDEIIYNTSDLIPLKADKDKLFSKANKRRKPSNSPKQPLTKKYKKA